MLRPYEATTGSFPADVCLGYTATAMTRSLRYFACLISLALAVSAHSAAQNQPQKPQAGTSFMAPPQSTAADQQNFPALLLQQLSAIKAAALNDDYAYRELAHLTENIGARPTGSVQARTAAEYVAGELRKLGLEVRLEPVTVPHWVRGTETAALVEYPAMIPGTTQKIVLTALGGSSSTPAGGL